ncbi:MAG TPA: hypothetical protein VMI54_04200 [Polyangiaceae bacterium]|nr:hypothetical protein [Polyangiaceae bacterium]
MSEGAPPGADFLKTHGDVKNDYSARCGGGFDGGMSPLEQDALRKEAATRMIRRVWHKTEPYGAMDHEAELIFAEAKQRLEEANVLLGGKPLKVNLLEGPRLELSAWDHRGKEGSAKVRRDGTFLQESKSKTKAAVWDEESATFKPEPDTGCAFAIEAVLKVLLETATEDFPRP